MERRRRTEREAASPPPRPPPPPPPPPPDPSSCLRDVSNYKTPRPHVGNPSPKPSSPLLFFTASKKTPTSSASSSSAFSRRPSAAPASRIKATRRLKALELEQSRCSHKAQIRREKALLSFSRSVSAWLNFLFENPGSCGCNVGQPEGRSPSSIGKRESLGGERGIGVSGRWRSPKRQRKCSWRAPSVDDGLERVSSSLSSVSFVRASLQEVCSLEDMKERMEAYMSSTSCKEVLSMMSQVCKNIDEGRLKMKAHCPIVTDLRLKEKAIKILMCYNPLWLRIGLHIVLGGDSLLLNEGQSDQEDLFLKVIVEKQFFSHFDLAKKYSYNKLVEGLYRPGYFEALGNIILKRFLLLVISLDKAKCENTLPIKYGIDGQDGGSPLLFCRHSSIKSTRQVIHEFLSEVMHGEGDLLAHLVTMGCKVNYQQSPLAEYDFRVTNLFEDLQNGILLCRAIHLLQCDASILSKVMAPSDNRKKDLQNVGIAIQYLKQAGIPLLDEDGVLIVADDVTTGDKELTLSMLWNMFLHLQVPLLIDKTSLVEEIIRMKGSDVDLSKYNTMTHMDMLLEWVQVACERYLFKFDSFSSLIDGKAFRFLINYYLGTEDVDDEYSDDLIRRFDNVPNVDVHGFVLVQRVTAVLGNFPEVLQVSDIVDRDVFYDERSVIILLVFLASQLIHRKNLNQLTPFRVTRSNYRSPGVKASAVCQSPLSGNTVLNPNSIGKTMLNLFSPLNKEGSCNCSTEERSATIIQSRFRGFTQRNKFFKVKVATSLLQAATRAWLAVTLKNRASIVKVTCSVQQQSSGIYDRYLKLMIERHQFVNSKKSVLIIQREVRSWLTQKDHREYVIAAINLQSYIRGCIGRSRCLLIAQLQKQRAMFEQNILEHQSRAAIKIQLIWRSFTIHKFHSHKRSAAIKIQSHWRGWYARKNIFYEVRAIIRIQTCIRGLIHQKAFGNWKLAAVEIQRIIRGQLARNRMSGSSYLQSGRPPVGVNNIINTSQIEHFESTVVIHSVLKLQRWWKQVLLHKSRTLSATSIQSFVRGWSARRATNNKRHVILIIQRWWRKIFFLKSREKSVLIIQAHFHGWIARRAARQEKQCIVIIQSYWKGFLVRKASKQHVSDLRRRLERSTANVDDDMRLINRLVAALSELLGRRSISNIRHTCATLNMATDLLQKCCETLVSAGAIDVLLKQIHSLNRGIPDQEVLKHVLCTLRNIVRYPHLAQVLINTPQSVEIIFQELLRNKSEGFFVACELLKKLCATQEGFEAITRLQGHIKRLKVLAQDLERKAELQKREMLFEHTRGHKHGDNADVGWHWPVLGAMADAPTSALNAHLSVRRDTTMRRLKETVDLLLLVAGDCR